MTQSYRIQISALLLIFISTSVYADSLKSISCKAKDSNFNYTFAVDLTSNKYTVSMLDNSGVSSDVKSIFDSSTFCGIKFSDLQDIQCPFARTDDEYGRGFSIDLTCGRSNGVDVAWGSFSFNSQNDTGDFTCGYDQAARYKLNLYECTAQ